jgi:trimeric autotransporter adhesin
VPASLYSSSSKITAVISELAICSLFAYCCYCVSPPQAPYSLEALDDLAAASHRQQVLSSSSALDARAARSAVSEDIVQDILGGEEVQWPPATAVTTAATSITTATADAATTTAATTATAATTMSRTEAAAAAFAATAGAVMPLFSSSVADLARFAKKPDFRRWTQSGVMRLAAVDVTAATDEFGSTATSDWDWAALWNGDLPTTNSTSNSGDSISDNTASSAAAAAGAGAGGGVAGVNGAVNSLSSSSSSSSSFSSSSSVHSSGSVNGIGEHVRRELAAADVDAALAQLPPDEEEEMFDPEVANAGNREVYNTF